MRLVTKETDMTPTHGNYFALGAVVLYAAFAVILIAFEYGAH